MSLEILFKQFVNEKRYVTNSSHNTILFYEQSFRAFNLQDPLTKSQLSDRITTLRQRGMSPTCCNAYIRGINSFLTWLKENEHSAEHFKIKSLKAETRIMKTFTEAQIKTIITLKPKSPSEVRLHALLCFVIDTGVRINEALTLTRNRIDFDNLLVTVLGKGNKERVIPISQECRRILFRLLQSHKYEFAFCTRNGSQLLYDNTRRDLNRLMERLGINGFDGSFHAFRRFFARNYVRNGGNLFYLQKMLGHTTLSMSRKYVEVEAQDLSDTHQRASILGRARTNPV